MRSDTVRDLEPRRDHMANEILRIDVAGVSDGQRPKGNGWKVSKDQSPL